MKKYVHLPVSDTSSITTVASKMVEKAKETKRIVVTRFLDVDIKAFPTDSVDSIIDAFEEKYQPMPRML